MNSQLIMFSRSSLHTRLALPSLAAALLCLLCNGSAYAQASFPDTFGPPAQKISLGPKGGAPQGRLCEGRLGGKGSDGTNGDIMRSIQKLNLTEDQKQKMEAVKKEGAAQAQPLKERLREKRTAMFAYLSSPNATESKALSLQQEMMQIQGQLGELRVKTWFKMREIFTPEQLQTLEKERGSRLDRMPKGPGGGKPPFGPRSNGIDLDGQPGSFPDNFQGNLPSSEAYLSQLGAFLPGPRSLLN